MPHFVKILATRGNLVSLPVGLLVTEYSFLFELTNPRLVLSTMFRKIELIPSASRDLGAAVVYAALERSKTSER